MKRYLFIFAKYRLRLILLAVVSIIATLLGIISIYYSGQYIDIVVAATEVNTIIRICIILFLITAANLLLNYLNANIKMTLIEMLVFEIKKWVIAHLRKISLYKYKEFEVGYLSKRIEEDSKQVVQFFVDSYIAFGIRLVELIIVSALILSINFPIGILMFLLCPIYFLVNKAFQKPIFQKTLEARESSANFFQQYIHQLNCMDDLVMEAEFERDDSQLEDSFSTAYKKYKDFVAVSSKLKFIQGFIVGIMQILIFIIGGISVLNGNTTIGLLTTLMVYFSQILNNISYYVELAKRYQISKSSLHRMDEILDIAQQKEGNCKLDDVSSITAQINFSINETTILDNISLTIHKGETVGVLGKNGAGKSTFLKLIMGAIKADKNENSYIIFNSEHEISELDCDYLRNKTLSYISQKVILKEANLCESLNEFCPHKTPEEFLANLIEQGIPINDDISNTVIANWNMKVSQLSGGERQLAAVIRGITKRSRIIIMDEPTSNLDQARIGWLVEVINAIKREKIIFVATHEKAMMDAFDKVIMLDKVM